MVEEIKINDDKSGSISYKLETNEFATLLNRITGFLDVSFESQFKTEAAELASRLKDMEGIENVVFETDDRSGYYGLSFDFSNTKELNNALYEISGNKKNIFSPGYIKISKHKFKKLNFAPWVKKYFEKENIKIPESEILDLFTYKSIIHFPNEIIRINKKTASVSDNRKTIIQAYSIEDIFENKIDAGIKAKY